MPSFIEIGGGAHFCLLSWHGMSPLYAYCNFRCLSLYVCLAFIRCILPIFIAESFLDKFSMVIGPTHQSELQELSEVVSAEQVSTSSLVKKFRNQKFFLKMSNSTFQLLMQFLQVTHVCVTIPGRCLHF